VADYEGVYSNDKRLEGKIHKGLDLWESYHGTPSPKKTIKTEEQGDEETRKQKTKDVCCAIF